MPPSFLKTLSTFLVFFLCTTSFAPSAEREIILVFKTHFDIGYTDLAENVLKRYRTEMIDHALEVVDRNRELPPEKQFVWTLPGWPLAKILEDWEGQTPERKEQALQAFREGRFAVHALPFTLHTETVELEDLVRGLRFASDLSRSIDVPLPKDAKMTDVPSHTWVLPTLLKHAGIEFLHLGCNPASTSPNVPALFWWEGPDGSRVLTMYSAANYGSGIAPPEDWPYKTWLALIHTGDNHGPPSPEEVTQLLDEAKEKMPDTTVRIGRLSDFAEAILKEHPDLPVVRGDMPDTWIHGPMCDPVGEKIARNARPKMVASEMLDTELRLWNASGLQPLGETQHRLKKAYEQSLLYGEHTWGGALAWITSYSPAHIDFPYGKRWAADYMADRFERLEKSWEDHTDYSREASRLTSDLLDDAVGLFAAAVGGRDENGIVVFNPLPWERTMLVRCPIKQEELVALYRVGDDGKRRSVPFSRDMVRVHPLYPLGESLLARNHVIFVAENIPACGYRCFELKQHSSIPPEKPESPFAFDPESGSFETPFYKGKIDLKRGTIAELIDLRTGRTLSKADGGQQIGQLLHEYFDADQVRAYNDAYTKIDDEWAKVELAKPAMLPASDLPYWAISPAFGSVEFTNGPLSLSVVLKAEKSDTVPYAVQTTLTFYRHAPHIDLATSLFGKPAEPWPEAIWICFPFAIEQPNFKLMRLGSLVDPKTDLVPGSNHDLFWLSGGAAMFDAAGAGVGVCPLDHGLIALDQPGCWKYSPDFVPEKSNLYVNLYNNQWSTNFRLWNGGSWSSRVRIWGIEKYDAEASLITPCLEARNPVISSFFPSRKNRSWEVGLPSAELPLLGKGPELSRKGVGLTSLGLSEDGTKIRLRLWELAGISGRCTVSLPKAFGAKEVQPVDLRDRPFGKPIPVVDDRFELDLEKFAPKSLEISR